MECVKEMLNSFPGFSSLYLRRKIAIDDAMPNLLTEKLHILWEQGNEN
ncbi:hypothetical protein QUF80_11060 [Desulfococcaceae bacterium HSG8]|nr:hypothetical protein [Desulfococcaceae bacterium HSG8]